MPIPIHLPRPMLLAAAIAVPLGVVGVLSAAVLLPTLKNPESKVYGSALGYPSIQRLLGQPIAVQAVPVSMNTLEESLAAAGESVALQKVSVRPSVTGIVDDVYVTEGQQVRRGQPLLKLKQEPFRIAVETAQVELASAEARLRTIQESAPIVLQRLRNDTGAAKNRHTIAAAQLKRMEGLVEEGAVSRFQESQLEDSYVTRQNEMKTAEQLLAQTEANTGGQLANAQLEVETRRLALRNAQHNLDYTTLYATTDGLVSETSIHSGEMADTTSPTPLIVLSQNIVFKAFIDQARLNAVKVGDRALIRLVAYPGRSFNGRVIRLNPTVQTESTQLKSEIGVDHKFTYSVWVAVDELQMPPGLQGFIQFSQGKESMVVPEKAVTHLSGGEGMVMVNQAGTAIVKKVSLGRVINNQREVLAGLQPHDQVVVSASAINPGDRLSVQLADSNRSSLSLQSQAPRHSNE